ncbi:MAG: hypothetical protein AABY00_02185 [Nanoarchaeota archaeon]
MNEQSKNKEIREYKITFTIAESLPEDDTGCHEYQIIDGKRYSINYSHLLFLSTNGPLRKAVKLVGVNQIKEANSRNPDDPVSRLEMIAKWNGWFGLLDKIIKLGDKYLGT